MASILVVDDEQSMREVLELLLARAGYAVQTAGTLGEALARLEAGPVDLILSDFRLGKDSGLDVLRAGVRAPGRPEVIIITAFGTPASAVAAMRQGAYDYIAKPFDNDELLLLIERALEKRRLASENRNLKASLPARAALIGKSPATLEVWAMIEKIAPTRSTVLITGESGTGKEVVARALHNLSPRSGSPFVAINCAALAEGVLESELFGHVRGAFTGAHADHSGILVQAGDGTVLLDEIGELALGTQVKLLRVLQERRVRPVGSSREVPFEARVLAATNRELEADVKAGRFRQDLLFRLNVITLELKPLRARREDIEPLANHFLARVAQELGRPGLRLADETIALLREFPFSGNVRQLQNLVERAATLSDGDLLGPDALPPAVLGRGDESGGTELLQLADGFSLERHMDTLERRYLSFALSRAGGVKTRAAELLGLSFRSLRYRLAKHGLDDRDDRSGSGKGGP
jgi:two-component system response regulator PilR (NtrC family)